VTSPLGKRPSPSSGTEPPTNTSVRAPDALHIAQTSTPRSTGTDRQKSGTTRGSRVGWLAEVDVFSPPDDIPMQRHSIKQRELSIFLRDVDRVEIHNYLRSAIFDIEAQTLSQQFQNRWLFSGVPGRRNQRQEQPKAIAF
jgi:hypothetical protein